MSIAMRSQVAEEELVVVDEHQQLVLEENPPKGCWWRFTTFMASMWATKDINQTDDREIVVRTTIRELVLYLIFLVILCIREYISVF